GEERRGAAAVVAPRGAFAVRRAYDAGAGEGSGAPLRAGRRLPDRAAAGALRRVAGLRGEHARRVDARAVRLGARRARAGGAVGELPGPAALPALPGERGARR